MAKLGVLITLLAIFGPVASQLQGGTYTCFSGWLKVPVLGPLCPRGSTPNPPLPSLAPSGSGLSYGYYDNSDSSSSYCPSAEGLVKQAVEDAVYRDRGIGAGLIRLFFHDCFVRGCDASVLLNTTASKNDDTEREGPPNKNSLRGFEVIDAAKAAIEAACPGKVSCADVVAFAARDASTVLSGGRINMNMPGGRRDGRESFASETDQLPGPFSSLADLQAGFRAKGLTSDEMVTLSGAHTIGNARCAFFSNRLPPNPTTMDAAFAAKLKDACTTGGETRVDQDYQTPDVLDSKYYNNVLDGKALFDSDDALRTVGEVEENAKSPETWERKFEKAMENMGKIIDVRSSTGGEIRRTCWKVNEAGN